MQELGQQKDVATMYMNIGMIYSDQKKTGSASEYLTKALDIFMQEGDKYRAGKAFINLGNLYFAKDDHSGAEENYKKALQFQNEIGDKEGQANSLNALASVFQAEKKYSKALECGNQALALGKEIGFPQLISESAMTLFKLQKLTNDHKHALENYELFIRMRDSINNESTRKASIRSQLKYEYEKQAAADSVAHAKESEIKNAELKRQEAEIKAKKNQQYALFGGLFLVGLFSIFMYNRFKVTQKQKVVIEHQKEIVEEQKKIVEEKQLEILDSIKYAKRIQMAQIPSDKRVHLMLKRMRSPEVK
jgi:tetratricopeptide (TPR) repeat protein